MTPSFSPSWSVPTYRLSATSYVTLKLIYLHQNSRFTISFYLFVNPNLLISPSIPFSLSLCILRVSTYICSYLLSIHLCFFISLCQVRLIPISFYLFINPNLLISPSIPFPLSLFILRKATYICFYLLSIHLCFFISLCHVRLIPISFNYIFFISAQSSSMHQCFFSSLVYSPLSLSISCLSKFTYISFNPLHLTSTYLSYIDLYLFLSFFQSKFTAISLNILLFISVYPSCIYLYHFLSLVYLFVNPGSS